MHRGAIMRGSPVTRLQMAASEHVQSSKAKQTRPHPSANDESVLSQKVYDSEGYPILLRTYVSRRSAGKGRALLEKLGLSPEKIALCYSKYPQDEEEVVQEGLYAWKDDVSSEPTWKTLVDAMLYAGIGVQYVEELKEELYQCENVFAPKRKDSMPASSLVLPVPVCKADVTLAAVLMEFLKQYVSSQSMPSDPTPSVFALEPDSESSGQSPVASQPGGTIARGGGGSSVCLNIYRMSSSPRGLAVVISNERFTGRLATRVGAHIDVKNLHRLFSWLGYKMMLFVNLTAAEIVSTVQQLASLDHTHVDSVVLCMLTHGDSGKLYGSDEESVPIEKVFGPLNGANSPTLIGKPKIFLIAADRGTMFDCGVDVTFPHPSRDGDSEPSRGDGRHTFEALKAATEALCQKEHFNSEGLGHEGDVQVLPVEADFVIVYATPFGYLSWRNAVFGTWFIKAFVDVMFEHAAKCHFLEILTFLNNRMGRKFQSRNGCKQIAETVSRLMKLLYFNPLSPHPPVAQPETGDDIPLSDPANPQWPLLVRLVTVADTPPSGQ